MLEHLKVALVHDWLTGMRGGEYVLEAIAELLPHADIYTLVHAPGSVSASLERHRIFTSFLQRWPNPARFYRHYLPFMPRAIEQFDLSGYPLIISTSHCVAKGAIPGPRALHICYCHTPMRYIWDQYEDYFGKGRAPLWIRQVMQRLAPRLRWWDLQSVPRVHHFIANSYNVAERIRRLYNRSATVIYPPVDTTAFQSNGRAPGDFYLMVTAFAPYKRVDIAIEAFNQLRKPLVVIGEGQEYARLKAKAGPAIEFLGWKPKDALSDFYRRCRALIFPGEEDFGIVPVEAQASGRPVIAYRCGGALETVREGVTGFLFEPQTPKALAEAVRRFERMTWDPTKIRENALQYDQAVFLEKMRQTLMEFTRDFS